jgi:hypothetical protein
MGRAALSPVLVQAGHNAAAEWQRSIPHEWPGQNGTPTGNTARSITVQQHGHMSVGIGTNSVSGRSLETGARDHLILPKRYYRGGKYRNRGPTLLAWPPERGGAGPRGSWRVRRAVWHPGVSERRYGYHAVEKQRSFLYNHLAAALRRIP